MAGTQGSYLHAAEAICLILILAAASTARAATSPHTHARKTLNSRCIAAERAALLSFKGGITRDPLKRLESWRGQDCCEWSGVGCSNRTGRVIKLDLRNPYSTDTETFVWCFAGEDNNGMRGKISTSLLDLEHLKVLDLTRNNLGGVGVPIPAFLGSLKSLTRLSLACMNFDGRVPPQLGNLSRLQHLNLNSNYYRNNIVHSDDISWLRHLNLLRFLDMSGLNLSTAGDWVRTVTHLSSLEVLQLSDCGLRLPHEPIAYSNLSSLQTLDLAMNRVDTLNPSYWFWNVRTIKELVLRGNQITGQFPDAVGNMTSLEVLDLGGNSISNVKSERLKGLCNLMILNLWSNQINQDMSEFMDGMPSCIKSTLRGLDLSATNLTGGIPSRIKQWQNLTELQLYANRLAGSIPLEIGNLTYLWGLDLADNQLNGSISEEHFTNLVNLGVLDLSFNSLHIEISSNWVPPFSLVWAYFTGCKMGPHFPLWLERQKDISILDISDTGIVDHLPQWFWTVLSNISHLNISNNQIKGSLPTTMGFMSSATMLDLSSNSLSGVLPLLPNNLFAIDVSKNSLSGPLPQNFGAPMLRELLLSSNRINGTIPAYICQLHDLQLLDLSGNLLVGKLPHCSEGKNAKQKMNKTIDSTTKQLSVLVLNNNNLSGKFPEFLQQSMKLTLLDLSYNKFFGELPTWIAEKLPDLSYMQLRFNMFSGSIQLQLTELGSLQFLDIANNRLSGTIPQALGNLKAMFQYSRINSNNPLRNQYEMLKAENADTNQSIKYVNSLPMVMKGQELYYTSTIIYMVGLDLSCNNLVGEIPDEISSLTGLINLNLSHNQLTGKIPEKIGLLQVLESLDLSFNALSGEIPGSLTEITSLSDLNLSYNNLSGRIPSGNQLQTLGNPESMYIGNIYLCGPPVSRKCLVAEEMEDHHGRNEAQKTYFFLGLAIGFAMGIWMVFVIFLFKNSWRVAYFQLLDKLLYKIQATVAKMCAR